VRHRPSLYTSVPKYPTWRGYRGEGPAQTSHGLECQAAWVMWSGQAVSSQ
jgi:hypothetical protein